MFEEKVKQLLEQHLETQETLFLIDFSITPDHKIKVVLDGDNGVTLKDCTDTSRAIEHNLDREEVDFALEVTSAGATAPLQMPRQYKKNIGRFLEVKTTEATFEGKLIESTENGIKLTWKTREPKPVGKGKVSVKKEKEIEFSDIIESKVVIKF